VPVPPADTETEPESAAIDLTGPINYLECGWCRRKGAYVTSRFPMLRCKYCGGRHPLDEDDWQAALRSPR
jgi:hypothetical protein